jgi:DNA-binding beta-propeller fold protein YncE
MILMLFLKIRPLSHQRWNFSPEATMRRLAIVLLLLLIPSLQVKAQSAPELPFESVPNLLHLPAHLYLGEVAGVAVNSKGHIFVYSRSGHTQLLEFGSNGKFLRIIGDDLYGFSYAHSVRVDKNDNIWTVDEGSNLVVEFNPQGQVVMVLGRKAAATTSTQPGARAMSDLSHAPPSLRAYLEQETFYRPTDVAFGLHGEVYVSDGYGNSRIVKYDKDGKFIKTWGKKGSEPGEFSTPHSVATDANGNVYVADVNNSRIQIFDADGNFLKQWTQLGTINGLCITPPPRQILYAIEIDKPGFPILKLDLNGDILGVIDKEGKKLGQFDEVHGMACPSENLLYVGEVQNWRVQKLILHPSR